MNLRYYIDSNVVSLKNENFTKYTNNFSAIIYSTEDEVPRNLSKISLDECEDILKEIYK